MTGPAFDRIVDALRAAGRPVTMDGPGRARSSCPAHDGDNRTALSILDTADRVNLHCFTAECASDAILGALGLDWRDRYHENRRENLATYRYDDGREVHRKRAAPKTFRQSRADAPPTLYRLSGVRDAAAAGRPVWLTEGEEDVHALETLGATATTAPQGATNFALVDAEPLRGASVVAIVDRDAAGDRWALAVRDKLAEVGASVRFVVAASGKDAADHVTAGHGLDEFRPYLGPEPAQPAEDAPRGRSTAWARVDLGPTLDGLLAGTLARPAPTVGRIAGGVALFYRGKVNGLAGESGAGKTWTALAAAVQCLDQGEGVVYVDHEDDALGVVGRLLDLGARPEDVRRLFAYLNPCERPTGADLADVVALVKELRAVLVVVDSTGEGLALDGANPNADEEVAAWFLRVPRRLASVTYGTEPGPAVVVLDHVTKTDEAGLWPIGSQRKRAAISGAQYMQRVVRPFDRDTAGAAVLVCAKDRHGNYRAGLRVAELNVSPGPHGVRVTLDAVAPQAPGEFRPTGYMEKVSRALERAHEDGAAPLSYRGIEERVTGKKDLIARAVAALVDAGHITTAPGPRNATLHTLARPFRESESAGGTLDAATAPERVSTVPRPLERGTGGQWPTVPGGQSGDSGGQSTDEDVEPSHGFTCADCGTPIPSGFVRCLPCRVHMTGGAA